MLTATYENRLWLFGKTWRMALRILIILPAGHSQDRHRAKIGTAKIGTAKMGTASLGLLQNLGVQPLKQVYFS